MEYITIFTRIIIITFIPIIVRYILKYNKNIKKTKINELNYIEFSIIFKLIAFSAFIMSIIFAVSEYKNNGIVDMLIMLPLVILFLFSVLYFCGIKIIINPNLEYFIFRNILFIKKKIYYCDISYAQIKKNTLYIFLKNGRKKMVDMEIIGIELLFSSFGKNKVTVKKRIK